MLTVTDWITDYPLADRPGMYEVRNSLSVSLTQLGPSTEPRRVMWTGHAMDDKRHNFLPLLGDQFRVVAGVVGEGGDAR